MLHLLQLPLCHGTYRCDRMGAHTLRYYLAPHCACQLCQFVDVLCGVCQLGLLMRLAAVGASASPGVRLVMECEGYRKRGRCKVVMWCDTVRAP